jgi:biopolymer transport protein ExbD
MVRISLTPIIDVVFILLIFFMLATNFQSFNQTDIKLSNEEASTSQSDKKIYLVEFNKEGEFKLNKATMSQKSIKNKILDSKKKDEEYIVVIKGAKDTEIQDILNVIADFKKNNIKEITIGISKNDLDENNENEKKDIDMPLLEKL